jgi:hypothetical protein
MAKPQRKSINDALAEIASQAPAPTAPARDQMETDNVPRGHGPRVDVGRDHATAGSLVPMARENTPGRHLAAGTDEDGYRVRIRREKPHVSLYAHPRVFAAIRDLAVAQRKKPHDLYVEGLRLMLAQYGLDFDELDGGRRA